MEWSGIPWEIRYRIYRKASQQHIKETKQALHDELLERYTPIEYDEILARHPYIWIANNKSNEYIDRRPFSKYNVLCASCCGAKFSLFYLNTIFRMEEGECRNKPLICARCIINNQLMIKDSFTACTCEIISKLRRIFDSP